MIWALLVVVGFSLSTDVHACSCIRQTEDERTAVKEALEQADLVFVGRIESTENYNAKEYDEEIQFQRTGFVILQSWKGEKANRVYVQSPVTCCLCGYPFPRSGVFLVYAYASKDGYYATSSCSRTKPRESADDEIEFLNEISTRRAEQSVPADRREDAAPAER
jgi:hypothetical protein